MQIQDVLDSHEKILFLLNGGKDSVAAFYHLEEHWDRLDVGWIHTNDFCPEIEEFVRSTAIKAKSFTTVYSDSKKWQIENGWPYPVVPMDYTPLGQKVNGKTPITISSYLDCCKANIWDMIPVLIQEIGATAVLTGQRKQDHSKDPRPSGAWIKGAQYFYPIDDWTDDQVRAYLKDHVGLTDPRFYTDDTSIDCRNCTGYPQYKTRTEYIKTHHPEQHAEVDRRWSLIKDAVHGVTNEI
jgi:3'-phosphoadenosine 5'-phosphosulfate sulfotransferase (PAPS reductase)/FAD synthetase